MGAYGYREQHMRGLTVGGLRKLVAAGNADAQARAQQQARMMG